LSDAGASACAERDEVFGPRHFAIFDKSLGAELAGSFPVFLAAVEHEIVDENHCALFHRVS
jgi:hypothetical protein